MSAGGPNFGTITVSGVGRATGTTNISVSFTVSAPVPAMNLITNGASFVTGPVAAGEMISIFGNAATPIGPPTAVALNGINCPTPCTSVPTSMGGVQVIFQPSGVAAPLTYVSSTQINALVPYEVLGSTSGQVQVKYLGQTSNPMTVQYAATQPGIFTALGTGSGLASVQQYDEQGTYQGQNSSSNPAKAGWYLTLYVTGEGIIPAPAVTGKVTCGGGRVAADGTAQTSDRQPALDDHLFCGGRGFCFRADAGECDRAGGGAHGSGGSGYAFDERDEQPVRRGHLHSIAAIAFYGDGCVVSRDFQLRSLTVAARIAAAIRPRTIRNAGYCLEVSTNPADPNRVAPIRAATVKERGILPAMTLVPPKHGA